MPFMSEVTHPSLGKLCWISTWWWLSSSAVLALNTCIKANNGKIKKYKNSNNEGKIFRANSLVGNYSLLQLVFNIICYSALLVNLWTSSQRKSLISLLLRLFLMKDEKKCMPSFVSRENLRWPLFPYEMREMPQCRFTNNPSPFSAFTVLMQSLLPP